MPPEDKEIRLREGSASYIKYWQIGFELVVSVVLYAVQLPEAVSWAAREQRKRELSRPVIVALTLLGEAGTKDIARDLVSRRMTWRKLDTEPERREAGCPRRRRARVARDLRAPL